MSPFYDDPSLADDRSPYEGLFDAQMRLPLQPHPLVETILKRDGRPELYDPARIVRAIREAAGSVGAKLDTAGDLARAVTLFLSEQQHNNAVTVDQVHEAVERVLSEMNAKAVASAYARLHRRGGKDGREVSSPHAVFDARLQDVWFGGARSWNATQSERRLGRAAKEHYARTKVYSWDVVEAHRTGDVHLHELDAMDRLESIHLRAPECRLAAGDCGPTALIGALMEYGEAAIRLGDIAAQVRCDVPLVQLGPALQAGDGSWYATAADVLARTLAPGLQNGASTLHICARDAAATAASIDFVARLLEGIDHLSQHEPAVVVETTPEALAVDAASPVFALASRRLPRLGAIGFRLHADQGSLLDGDYDDPAPAIGGRVTVNVGRAARKTGRFELFLRELDRLIEVAHRAHVQRYAVLSSCIDSAGETPFPDIAEQGLPFLLGVTGLGQAIETLAGEPAYAVEAAMELAEETLARIRESCVARPVGDSSPLLLAPTFDSAACARLDKLDSERFGAALAAPTPGVALAPEELEPFDAALLQGQLHPFLDYGHTCDLFVDPREADDAAQCELIRRVFCETSCEAVTLRVLNDTKSERSHL